MDDPDDHDNNDLPPSDKTSLILSYKDAIQALEDVQHFLEDKGHIDTSMQLIGPAVDALVLLRTSTLQQSTLHAYFSTQT